MKDQFVQDEWDKLCERVIQTANFADAESNEQVSLEQAKEFCEQEPPDRYTQLLDRVRGAAELAVGWHVNDETKTELTNASQ